MPLTTVVNTRHAKCDVYVGRGSKWGNPFSHIGTSMSRQACIEAYAVWLNEQPELLSAIHELKGKILGCYCRPLSCHGDVLAKLANELK